ncbi:hypothetical protein HHI36_022333 [Cryptolaemus montrouzieri]|uniref:Uncharacterized protein n=1 Tax=Cryptolaemus montrouzieri TaxID=559131 RepID=A0ABD2MZE4_9CUCU
MPKVPKSSQKRLVQSKVKTWNYSLKRQRSSLILETFSSPFARNSATRRIVSAVGYDRKSSSLNISPTDGKLRRKLIKRVENTEDDALMALHAQELLKKYGRLNMLDDNEDDQQYKCLPDERSFKKSTGIMSFRSSRKDSRTDILHSRISAPISYKT